MSPGAEFLFWILVFVFVIGCALLTCLRDDE